MIWLAIILIATTVEVGQGVPDDCYVIKTAGNSYCYTFSNTSTATHADAESVCASTGGQLGAISDETIWNSLKEKFLNNFKYPDKGYVWVGITVNADLHTDPEIDIKFVKWWEKYPNLSYYPNTCLAQYPPDWMWWGTAQDCSGSFHYFCQYYVKNLSCEINKIRDSNAIVQSCLNTTTDIPQDTTIQIRCSPGYYLNTSTHITCRNGKWDKIRCLPGCPSPGERNNARRLTMKTNYQVGESVSYICGNGYFNSEDYRTTHFSVNCKSDSTWSNENMGCTTRQKFSTIIFNVSSFTTSETELQCDLNATEKYWLRNGEYVHNDSSLIVKSTGNLIVKFGGADIFGYYICIGTVNNLVQIGSNAYELITRPECKMSLKKIQKDIEVLEGKNVFLACPQVGENHAVKWLKDGEEEIFGSQHRNIIPNTGLFLTHVTLQDEGIYECQVPYKEKYTYCKHKITYDVSVLALTESVCGFRSDATSNYQQDQPWLAVLRQHNDIIPFCYGTLINGNWVVTSAFCLVSLQRRRALEGVTVQLGSTGREKVVPVSAIMLHPLYKRRRSAYDIGLIQLLGAPVKFTKDILPICISPDDVKRNHKCQNVAELNGTVVAWGSLDGVDDENVLHVAEMTLVPTNTCRNASKISFAEDKFCAKAHSEKESFVGDNGSPFVVDYHGKNYLLGIYAWGGRENDAGNYDFFTSVSPYYDWIQKTVSKI